ncbi:MAG: M3 family metallopeptidase [Planctomycetes bacterium]|nr:M3 family metallopeptidase [Planctomycetota bacterium]
MSSATTSDSLHRDPAADPNPLLGPLHALPRFDVILAGHVEPAIRTLVADLDVALSRLESNVRPDWEGLVDPLERLVEPLRLAWGAAGHLMGVKNSPELRTAYETVQPDVVRAWTRIGQSRPLHEASKAMRASSAWATLSDAQRRIVEKMILDAELSGVGLDGPAKERFNAIQRELADLATRFGNHVLDATKAFALDLADPRDVDGLPESLLQLAAKAARESGRTEASAELGPWRITLDAPISGPFLQHSKRRELRERVYRAWIARASSGEFDNTPLIDRILALRDEKAKLLGFRDFAALSLASKMARSADDVLVLLEELRAKAMPAARKDFEELVAFARTRGENDVKHWDLAFWAERLREDRFAFSEEDLRPYFPLPKVLDGLFALAERLFDVRIVAADGETPVWHDDVRFFRILDAGGSPRAAFFLDPYSRPAEKRGGAWMDDGLVRSKLFAPPGERVRLPVAHLVCNGTPPVGERPSLMTFREVETLFHEFGHGLQHMLTTVDHESAAGINGVEWDAVELPSQFMENWCYHEPTLMGLSSHWQTGAQLPRALFDKIQAARTFRAGSDTLRQVYFACTDLALHHDHEPSRDGTPFDVMRKVADRTTVLPPLPEDRFLCSFTHVFAGGYAAGYYSYKWAEVLSADAFGAFEEAGLDDPAAVRRTGRRFRDTVLALGGSRHPMDVFEQFRGRKPSTEALLRHSGLTAG